MLGFETEFIETTDKLSEKLVKLLVEKKNSDVIEDDRRIHVLSRSRSRFAAPVAKDEVLSMEFHPAGSYLAYSRIDGSLTVWSLEYESFTKCKRIYLEDACGADKAIHSISWNPYHIGQFATSSNSNSVIIWNVDFNNNHLSVVKRINIAKKLKIYNCLYDNSGKYLITVTKNEELHLFDTTKEYSLKAVFKLNNNSNEEDLIKSICWSNSSSHIFIGLGSGKLKVLKVNEEGQLIPQLEIQAHRTSISCLKMHKSGKFLISGGEDGISSIWDLSTLVCKITITNIGASITNIDISSTGTILAICTSDLKVKFYEFNSGKLYDSLKCSDSTASLSFAFYPDKCWFVFSDSDEILKRRYTPSHSKTEMSLWKEEQRVKRESNMRIKNQVYDRRERDQEKSNTARRVQPQKRERGWDRDKDNIVNKRERLPQRGSRFSNRPLKPRI
ncbi:hypothetical protein Kpol_2000p39 [Vanderwaltozyma polyspora DSM 70294]|uniref:Uncharacterized protein n=1 Tax=Vanderwaltozyma polyspora (strain ATCC 22028 / DSM 70294 / BCRC 21397 / CBS 2163 / NBRC 10782 / NRRL Y-8283 / UCD 57-17) TaxID=436907 RepID=A7TF49_VANPO|nr:uncharacterized protein Kpol_2000p39 [Vanderwaltozyma polyspora DSM 70294]EDO19074.1 hypothetical protein Kpol_2000p39 [Vanderwaltozyma polyspora DSM 70294]